MKRRIMTVLIALVVLLFGFTLQSYAAIGSPGGSWYMEDDGIMYLNPINGTLNFPSNWYQFEDEIIGVVIGDGTRYIGDSAFDQMDNLEWVSLPEGLTSIGRNAFYKCPKLTEIYIPDSVTKIESSAFWDCTSLSQVKLSKGLTQLGSVFTGCTALESIVIPQGVTSISGTFSGCTNLKSVTLPDSITTIGERTFSDCSSLTGLSLPEGITVIQPHTFSGCTSLDAITLPAGLTKIGFAAFSNTGLKEIHIPDSVTELESHIFYDCAQLKEITIPENPDMLLGYGVVYGTAFYNDPENWDNGVLYLGKAVLGGDPEQLSGALTLRSDTLVMAEQAFMNCSQITQVIFPAGLKRIPTQAFQNCTGLTSLSLPEATTYIGGSAFEGAELLSEINLSANVQEVGSVAFARCAPTQSIYIMNPDMTIGSSSFGPLSGPVQGEVPMADAIIYGYSSSTAEAYAAENGIAFVSLDLEGPITGTCGENISWHLENWILTISGSGPLEKPDTGWPWSIYDNRYTQVVIEDGITHVGPYSFYNHPLLQSVSIPGSVTGIGENAFWSCGKLSSVTLSPGLTSIGSYAFSDCTSLSRITLPDTVTTLEPRVFDGCSGLDAITLSQNLTEIPEGTFSFCTDLKDITIPDNVTSIGQSVFYQCRSLSAANFGNGVESIGHSAFELSGLVEISLPSSLKTIGTTAFRGCSALRKVTLSEGITTIGENAFQECTNLSEINIPDSVTTIRLNAIPESCYLTREECNKNGLYYIDNTLIRADRALEGEIIIPEGTTCIASGALLRCEKITSVVIPEGITRIPDLMFYHTIGLKSVTMPKSLIAIDEGNFVNYNYDPLKKFTVYGYADSFAMEYAIENSRPFVALDVPFTDISSDQFYYVPVIWAYKNNITTGTSATTFGPDGLCTRSQVITFLWRTQGSPEPTIVEAPYTDLNYDSWYIKAALWAHETGVSTGIGGGKFGPEEPMTRSQLVTLLWRLAGSPAPAQTENAFSDVPEGTWYTDAVLWAVEKGITQGTGGGRFSPDTPCNRAVSVTFLYRYKTNDT